MSSARHHRPVRYIGRGLAKHGLAFERIDSKLLNILLHT